MGRQQGRHVARTGADFKHVFVFLHCQRLQGVGLDLGCKHRAAIAQRNFGVGESQAAVRRGNEFLALDDVKHIEHVRVQHLPRTQLLLDHVVAGLLEVHDISKESILA